MPITLKAVGARARVSVAEAQQMLADFQRQIEFAAPDDRAVEMIDISCRAWPLESLEVLRELFEQHIKTVKVLKIDDIIASLDTDDGLASLGFFNLFQDSPLQTLILDDNAVGIRGIEVLSPLIKNQNLQKLSLCNLGLSAESAAELDQHVPTTLISLDLGRNQIGPVGGEHVGHFVRRCTELKEFLYNGSRPLQEGTNPLCEGLLEASASGNFTRLELYDCFLGSGEEEDHPIHVFLNVLRNSPRLVKLNLNDCQLEEEGTERVIAVLNEIGVKLTNFGISFGEGGSAVAEYCVGQTQLEELNVECNLLEDEGVEKIVKAFRDRDTLRVLDVTDNSISEDGFQFLVDNPIKSLKKLVAKDNGHEDIDEEIINNLRNLYDIVILDTDDEYPEEETQTKAAAAKPDDGAAIDDLAAQLEAANL